MLLNGAYGDGNPSVIEMTKVNKMLPLITDMSETAMY